MDTRCRLGGETGGDSRGAAFLGFGSWFTRGGKAIDEVEESTRLLTPSMLFTGHELENTSRLRRRRTLDHPCAPIRPGTGRSTGMKHHHHCRDLDHRPIQLPPSSLVSRVRIHHPGCIQNVPLQLYTSIPACFRVATHLRRFLLLLEQVGQIADPPQTGCPR
jgi:hypothetical protein